MEMEIIIGHIIGVIFLVVAIFLLIVGFIKVINMDLDGPLMKTEIEISYKIKDDDKIDSGKSKSNKGEINKTPD